MRKAIAITAAIVLVLSSTILLFYLFNKEEVDTYEETKADFRITVRIDNEGTSQAVDIPVRIALPYDGGDNQRLISFSGSRPPERDENDSMGNRFLDYTVQSLGPGEEWNVTIDVRVLLRSTDYRVDKRKEGDFSGLDDFLLPSPLVNYQDMRVQELARDLSNGSRTVYDLAWKAYVWIIDNIIYQQVAGELDAATMLKNGEGGSAEFANLFVALMRANGIPARRVSGWGNQFEPGSELVVSRIAHGWAEFYLPGYGWMQVDPTWGRTQKFENFLMTDDSHVVMTKGEGIHFIRRGAYDSPFGDTQVGMDYTIKVLKIERDNLSMKRDIVIGLMFLPPLLFAMFLVWHRYRQRKAVK